MEQAREKVESCAVVNGESGDGEEGGEKITSSPGERERGRAKLVRSFRSCATEIETF